MKTLKESLLSRKSAAADVNTYAEVMEFLNKYYEFKENSIKIEPGKDKLIVNIDGHIRLNYTSDPIKYLTNGKFKFGTITGNFIISNGYLDIESLEGGPSYVGGCFTGTHLKITSLKGAPEEIGDFFDVSYNDSLESLEGGPKRVKGYFKCVGCAKLTNLKGAPEYVGNGFMCSGCNNLKSLIGAPKVVKYGFACTDCKKLKSFEGFPENFEDTLYCGKCNNIKSTKGLKNFKGLIKSEARHGQYKSRKWDNPENIPLERLK